MLTVLAWLWAQPQSRAVYRAEHVNIWAAMVRRNLSMPHRIACVTNIPQGIDPSIKIITPPGDFEGIVNPRWANGKPQCYRRLSMFRRDAGKIFGKRLVCMDLDCVIGGPLDPLFDRKDDLVLYKGTVSNRPYNGSMMLIRAGCRPEVFEDFTQEQAISASSEFCGSDQAWLARKLGWGEKVWSEADGVYWFNPHYARAAQKTPAKILFFPGRFKPWNAVAIDPFTRENYRLELKEAA